MIDKLILLVGKYVNNKCYFNSISCKKCRYRHFNLCVVIDTQYRRVLLKEIRRINKNAKEIRK